MSSKLTPKTPQTREDRLKAALKANLGRRKVQARAKAAQGGDATAPQKAGATAPQQSGEKPANEKE